MKYIEFILVIKFNVRYKIKEKKNIKNNLSFEKRRKIHILPSYN